MSADVTFIRRWDGKQYVLVGCHTSTVEIGKVPARVEDCAGCIAAQNSPQPADFPLVAPAGDGDGEEPGELPPALASPQPFNQLRTVREPSTRDPLNNPSPDGAENREI